MARQTWSLVLWTCILGGALPLQAANNVSKRGLDFVPNAKYTQDDAVWTQPGTDLTWYYNYKSQPSPQLASTTFDFVPMMWGELNGNPSDTSFLTDVKGLTHVNYALSFNEPDLIAAWGGSDMTPQVAAQCWVNNFVPIQKLGIKVGLPAVSGGSKGLPWLQSFLTECATLLGSNCTYDFVPIHSYGNFQVLADLLGQNFAMFPGKDIWVTEFAFQDGTLSESLDFFNSSMAYLDRLDIVTRYSYFGAFRSKESNVGPNIPFLNNAGQLTNIGAWYLGFNATNVDPQSRAGLNSPALSLVLAALAAVILMFEL